MQWYQKACLEILCVSVSFYTVSAGILLSCLRPLLLSHTNNTVSVVDWVDLAIDPLELPPVSCFGLAVVLEYRIHYSLCSQRDLSHFGIRVLSISCNCMLLMLLVVD